MGDESWSDKKDREINALQNSASASRDEARANRELAGEIGQMARQQERQNELEAERLELEEERLEHDEERLKHDERARQDLAEHRERVAEIETMKAVDVSSSGGVERLDQLKKDTLDRDNQQKLLDLLGDCVGCIETDGKASDKFDMPAYAIEQVDAAGLQKVAEKAGKGGMFASLAASRNYSSAMKNQQRDGISHAYKYQNLGAALALLIDLREELERVRDWDMNVSREATQAKIERYITMAREKQAKAALKTVRVWQKQRKKTHLKIGAWLLLAVVGIVGIVGVVFFMPEVVTEGDKKGDPRVLPPAMMICFGLILAWAQTGEFGKEESSPKKFKEPLAWDDMQEQADLD